MADRKWPTTSDARWQQIKEHFRAIATDTITPDDKVRLQHIIANENRFMNGHLNRAGRAITRFRAARRARRLKRYEVHYQVG